MKPLILVVEDDPDITAVVTKNLEAAGFDCLTARDGERGLELLQQQRPSLLVLDLGLPGIDGHEVMRRVRHTSAVPVLVLTARTGDTDKVLGFELGADDYVTKPFSPQELVARVRAILRRTVGDKQETALHRGALHIDPARREVRLGDKVIETTSLEFDLLFFLAARPGRVFSRDALMQQVWGHDRIVDTRSIDSIVSRLRKKLEPDPDAPRYVQTVWGAGYRFTETPP